MILELSSVTVAQSSRQTRVEAIETISIFVDTYNTAIAPKYEQRKPKLGAIASAGLFLVQGLSLKNAQEVYAHSIGILFRQDISRGSSYLVNGKLGAIRVETTLISQASAKMSLYLPSGMSQATSDKHVAKLTFLLTQGENGNLASLLEMRGVSKTIFHNHQLGHIDKGDPFEF